MLRLRRGIYRLVHFPAGEHEELIELWLWTERTGLASHQTALALHGLSDALPAQLVAELLVEREDAPAQFDERARRGEADAAPGAGDQGRRHASR